MAGRPTDSTDTEWLTLREAAELVGVHRTTIYNWIRKGALSCYEIPATHRKRVLRVDVERISRPEMPAGEDG
jgi:excisionase family DNA binding protein